MRSATSCRIESPLTRAVLDEEIQGLPRLSSAIAVSSYALLGFERRVPAAADAAPSKVEQWNDVPSASTNYAASSDSLRTHVKSLIERLARSNPR